MDKTKNKAIGTIELFHRKSNDYFNHSGVLRLDLKSAYEKTDKIVEIINIDNSAYELFNTKKLITTIPVYAIKCKAAFEKLEFTKS